MGAFSGVLRQMLEVSWFLEFALIAMAWTILRHSGPIKTILKPRYFIEALALMAADRKSVV